MNMSFFFLVDMNISYASDNILIIIDYKAEQRISSNLESILCART